MPQGVSIQYGDIAPNAKENFNITTTEDYLNKVDNLYRYNMELTNYGNPCELYQTVLDGNSTLIPSNTTDINEGIWSEQVTDEDGKFVSPIRILLQSEEQYSSQGFTFTFDKFNNIYPTNINIAWQREIDGEITTLSTQTFTPDSGVYFCRNQVNNFNRVLIRVYSLNMPYNRLKIECIDYGYGTIWYGDQLSNVKCIQEIDPIATSVPICTTDFTLNSKNDMIYSFQNTQPIITRFNDKIINATFIKKGTRTSQHVWEVQSEDYVSLMSNVTYVGGMYTDENAYDLLVNIFTTAKVPYEIPDEIKELTITGYLPYTNCKDALIYVLFAIQYIATTANLDHVKVCRLNNEISQTIGLDRIMQNPKFENTDTVTGVKLSVYTYKRNSDDVDVYKAEDSGTGENIFVKFSEPLHDLAIKNGSFVKDENGNDMVGTNYAYINANDGCLLWGEKYTKTETFVTKDNPVTLALDTDNVITYTNNTLINPNNADMVAENCLNYNVVNQKSTLKIVDRYITPLDTYPVYNECTYGELNYMQLSNNPGYFDKYTYVGDKIAYKTEYNGDMTGTIIKQTFTLNGNNINKETVLK